MCSISVDPMPSMIRSPVASRKACHVVAGRCSPAETARRSPRSCSPRPAPTIALYAVGAVNRTVTPCSATASASSSGVARSIRNVAAAGAQREHHPPPRPNVNANGAVVVNRSAESGRSTCRLNVSAMARTSRWKCIVTLGRPVVPEVNASRATSSAAVCTASNSGCSLCARLTRSSARRRRTAPLPARPAQPTWPSSASPETVVADRQLRLLARSW